MPALHIEDGLVYECVRCNICYIGYDSAGVIWKHAFKHCKLSAKDAGAVVGGWNYRKCRYGFVCGAYMPISNFSSGLQKALSYLPGTYGTSLVKNHMLNGVYKEMADTGLPSEAVTVIRNISTVILYSGDMLLACHRCI